MANKTEKPTQKKLQDASKKGQILKSRDLTISVIMLVGTLYLGYVFDVHHIMSILEYILDVFPGISFLICRRCDTFAAGEESNNQEHETDDCE